jgi:predicted AlkP superfamily pyrophosphatase or phosphodiesterase
MLNEKSIKAVNASGFSKVFVKPLYESYGFNRIPSTIKRLFDNQTQDGLPLDTIGNTQKRFQKVVVLFIDAFGWQFMERHKEHPFVQRFMTEGVVSKLTSQFPSTTAVHQTTMHTGVGVDQHAIPEFYYYEPKVDAVINPFLFSQRGDKKEEGNLHGRVTPQEIYPSQDFYAELGQQGVTTHTFATKKENGSTYNAHLNRSVNEVHSYKTLADGLVLLSDAVSTQQGKGYFYFYFANIDGLSHDRGPQSPHVDAEIKATLDALEHAFEKTLSKEKDTAVMVIADHGQASINSDNTIYLNQICPELEQYVQRNAKGQPMAPAGSQRNLFLHIKPEYVEEAKATLTAKLKGKAEVYTTEELIKQGFFGEDPSETLKSRLSTLMILPYEGQSVWWHEEGEKRKLRLGHHGGATKAEMEIPLLFMSFK